MQLLEQDSLYTDPAEKRRRDQERDDALQGLFSVELLDEQRQRLLLVLRMVLRKRR